MIRKTLTFLQKEVNDYLKLTLNSADDCVILHNVVSQEEQGTGTSKVDPNSKILLSLIHIEEERIFKAQDTYEVTTDGRTVRMEPELKFNLYVLFAANYESGNYADGLQAISNVIAFFQANNLFDAQTNLRLDPSLGKLAVDVYTQPLEKSFEFWQSLGGKFLPSIMYRVRVLKFREATAKASSPAISESTINGTTTSL